MKARVASVKSAATDVIWVELDPVSEVFPPYAPGSHVDFVLPGVGVRQYSLTGDGKTYSFAIQKEPSGRGGSVYLHDHLKIGMEVKISPPRNNFPLHADKPLLLLAGGIGITPFLSMLYGALPKELRLLYFARTTDRVVITPALRSLTTTGVASILLGKTPEDTISCINKALDSFPNEGRVYCCGPSRFIDSVRDLCAEREKLIFHSESFAPQIGSSTNGNRGFDVVLVKSNKRVHVAADKSILESLRAAGVAIDSSCESGLCGTCKIPYEGGMVEHRDLILTKEEQRKFLLSCCARSCSEELILSI